MDYFASLLVTGLVMGIIYAIMALGLTLIFSILNVINFAHGEFYMVGGYTSYLILEQITGIHPVFIIPIAGLVTAAIGAVFEILFLRPMHQDKIERPAEYAVLITFGFSFFVLNLALAAFGPYPHSPPSFFEGSLRVGTVISLSYDRVFACVLSLVLLGAVMLFMNRTWIGKALRAVSQDKQAAAVLGINPNVMNTVAFAFGVGLAGISGALLAPIFSVTPDVGAVPSIRSYIIIVLGGMGSLPGSVMGALLIGLVESFGAGYFPDMSRALNYKTAFGLVIFILVLLFKPSGFMGRKET